MESKIFLNHYQSTCLFKVFWYYHKSILTLSTVTASLTIMNPVGKNLERKGLNSFICYSVSIINKVSLLNKSINKEEIPVNSNNKNPTEFHIPSHPNRGMESFSRNNLQYRYHKLSETQQRRSGKTVPQHRIMLNPYQLITTRDANCDNPTHDCNRSGIHM